MSKVFSTISLVVTFDRDMLCCQWCYKKGNWPGKRVYCKATGTRDGPVHGNGNHSCRRFSGDLPVFCLAIKLIAISLIPYDWNLISMEFDVHGGHVQRRFCSHLGMTNQAVKAAQEAVQKSEELDIRYFCASYIW